MENFVFQNPTRIIFGKGVEKRNGQGDRTAISKKVLLHYGGGSIKKSGLYDRVCQSLKAAGVEWVELPGVEPNPRLVLVREGIRICRKEKLDFILAVGGGSVIDSAKAIGIGVPYDGGRLGLLPRRSCKPPADAARGRRAHHSRGRQRGEQRLGDHRRRRAGTSATRAGSACGRSSPS